jgi:hypothetical protein
VRLEKGAVLQRGVEVCRECGSMQKSGAKSVGV